MASPNWPTVFLDPNEHDTTMAVGEAHHGVHEMFVARRRVDLGDEFGGELFATREELAKFSVGEHDGRQVKAMARHAPAEVALREARGSGLASYPVTRRGQAETV
jgi:hypothetical protein